jgi:hypothetical protein
MKCHIKLQCFVCSYIIQPFFISLCQLFFSDPWNKRVETPWVSKYINLLYITVNSKPNQGVWNNGNIQFDQEQTCY